MCNIDWQSISTMYLTYMWITLHDLDCKFVYTVCIYNVSWNRVKVIFSTDIYICYYLITIKYVFFASRTGKLLNTNMRLQKLNPQFFLRICRTKFTISILITILGWKYIIIIKFHLIFLSDIAQFVFFCAAWNVYFYHASSQNVVKNTLLTEIYKCLKNANLVYPTHYIVHQDKNRYDAKC